MSVIVTGTGLTGFLLSAGLLAAGVSSMALRYALALGGAYVVFLLLIRLWVALHKRGLELDPDLLNVIPDGGDVTPSLGGGGDFAGGGASAADWHDAPVGRALDTGSAADAVGRSSSGGGEAAAGALDALDLDEGWLVIVPIVILVGGVVGSLLLLWSAPLLLAEVVVDVALVSGLYHRLSHLDRRSWLWTAVRKTWIPVVLVGFFLVAGGAIMDLVVPEARSIGEVLRSL